MVRTTGVKTRWHFVDRQSRASTQRETLAAKLRLPTLVAKLLTQRGYWDLSPASTFLEPRLSQLYDPALMPGVVRAAQRLSRAVQERQSIVIYGDYDVDGVTASAVLWHVLRLAGARADIYVPHRIEEGYGLNNQAIHRLAANDPLIVTVDCGITGSEPARVAKEAGIDLIITDHHDFEPPELQALPEAHTLVHPRLPGSQYPFGGLCGAAVAFKLAWQFAKVHCGSERLPEEFKFLLLDLLGYVALGTVADVVPLVDENRVLAACGLGRIKQTRFAGLNALIDASGLRGEKIDAYHVGFVLGPRLNACGRMGHAEHAVRLLTDAGPEDARSISAFLAKENDRRRLIEREVFDDAKQMIQTAGYDSIDHRAIVLAKAGWHPGVLGIVASRLVDVFARPVVMLNFQEQPTSCQAHGSARSVDSVSIYEALEDCATMLTSFGGHAMAAGLRLNADRVEPFRRRLVEFVNGRIGPEDLVRTIEIDSVCTLADVNVDIFDQIYRLAPFGRSNPWPVLCVQGVRNDRPAQRIGHRGGHLRLILRQGQRLVSAVAFGMGELADRLPAGVMLDVVFEPKIGTWQGRRRAELHIKDLCVI